LLPQGKKDASQALLGRRTVVFEKACEASIFERERLLAGNIILGPAVVTQMDSTTLVPVGWQATVDRHANLLIERH
jgi:N-methylhydantoinase A